jgi:hypothetical protein
MTPAADPRGMQRHRHDRLGRTAGHAGERFAEEGEGDGLGRRIEAAQARRRVLEALHPRGRGAFEPGGGAAGFEARARDPAVAAASVAARAGVLAEDAALGRDPRDLAVAARAERRAPRDAAAAAGADRRQQQLEEIAGQLAQRAVRPGPGAAMLARQK